jgi:GNAT superfamily N-acetyltransferase
MKNVHENIHRQLEFIEAKTLLEFHLAAPADAAGALGLSMRNLDGILVSVATHGNILVNRTLGLGIRNPATRDEVAEIRRLYHSAGVARYFVHASDVAEPCPISAMLEAAGLVRDRAWMKFARGSVPVEEPDVDLEIREIGVEHASDFGRIAATGFGLPEAAWDIPAALVGRPGWHMFMSFDGGEPAGTGALFVDNGVAWTEWGATDPAFRRRGSQSALLARRVNLAVARGCTLIGTCTGEQVAGEEQHSYRNIQRAGFTEIGLRHNYSPTGRPA